MPQAVGSAAAAAPAKPARARQAPADDQLATVTRCSGPIGVSRRCLSHSCLEAVPPVAATRARLRQLGAHEICAVGADGQVEARLVGAVLLEQRRDERQRVDRRPVERRNVNIVRQAEALRAENNSQLNPQKESTEAKRGSFVRAKHVKSRIKQSTSNGATASEAQPKCLFAASMVVSSVYCTRVCRLFRGGGCACRDRLHLPAVNHESAVVHNRLVELPEERVHVVPPAHVVGQHE